MTCTTNFVVLSGLLTRCSTPADRRKGFPHNTFTFFLLPFLSFVNIFPSRLSKVVQQYQLRSFCRQFIHRAKCLYQNRTLGPFLCSSNQAEYYQEVPHD